MRGQVGPVRALVFSADGHRLCVAGDDKCVDIWRRTDQGSWFYERTVRWQVQRGPRGRIHALAAAPGQLAMAGLGAMGEAGEILLVDPSTGRLIVPLSDPQHGHQERITSLAFSPDPQQPSLASMDMNGRLIAWTRNPDSGLWSPRTLADDTTHADSLRTWRMLHPVTMLAPDQVIAPFFAGADSEGRVRWHLRRYDLGSGDSYPLELPNDYHYFFVSALAAAPAKGRLASADDAGRLFLWSTRGQPTAVTLKLSAAVTSLQFNSQGNQLLLGTHASATAPGELRLIEINDTQQVRELWSQPVRLPVLACAISPDNEQFAYVQGGAVLVGSLAKPTQLQQLASPLRPPLRVAFRRGEPRYDIALGTQADDAGKVAFEHVFDTRNVQLITPQQIDEAEWTSPLAARGPWRLGTSQTVDAFQVYLERDGQRQAELPLRPDTHGAVSAECWIPDASGQAPRAVALGTNGTNNIYVFSLPEQGPTRLLRQFRGHEGAVTSIGVSTDRRYLVSAGLDGTVRVWKLADIDNDLELVQRWGAEFQAQDGDLVASSIRPDGPLFYRGLRTGDVVSSLRLPDFVAGAVQVTTIHEPDTMRATLLQRPWDQMVAFDYRRGRQALQSFQMYPAWQPLVSLFVADNREWAYWTPSGYYDASFEGDKLFGWQVNRGLQQLPDFFLAAQVRQTLERPEIMARLLDQGSLEDAFQAADRQAPANWSRVLIKQQQLKPDIQILAPRADEVIEGETMSIQAAVDVPAGERLVAPKAFVNGVYAGKPLLVRQTPSDRGRLEEYRWESRIPADPRLLVQVVAATEQEVAGRAEMFVAHRPGERKTTRQMHILTVGINDYVDGRLTRLDFAVNNALMVAETLSEQSSPTYTSHVVSLIDRRVTRPMWNLTAEQFAKEMSAAVSPDDLLVIFLSGHGLRDVDEGGYYYVTADAQLIDLLSGQYADCLSFSDIAATFAEIPCRKLVILDTCHSGAIQPLHQRELKAAVRALQDDLVFTLSATEGGQEAVEDREKRFGRFTFHLLEGLRGAADQLAGNGDRQVSLDELIRYVKATVAAESSADSAGPQQFPTAGPAELIEHVQIPLTTSMKAR